jgi:mannose/cellobiose epimerase-like protein (N-acyl-D-glucosamine 2-epimerase family)
VADLEAEVISAAQSLWRYLDVPVTGLWHDKMLPDGTFVTEAAPASSFYHIIVGMDAITAAARSRVNRDAAHKLNFSPIAN